MTPGGSQSALAGDGGDLSGLWRALEAGPQPLRTIPFGPPAHGRRVLDHAHGAAVPLREWPLCEGIFAERFGDDIVAPYARRTARLQSIIHHLGLALGGRPGQGLARRLLMPVSKDTLLRLVRARAPEAKPASRVIGIDDWAWKRGHRYGTIVCDLERREIVDLLPDREAATVEAWLKDHPARRDRLARPWGRLRSGGRPRNPGGDAGRRPLAPDGERQPRLPRRGAAIDGADPPGARRGHRRPGAADLRGADAVRGLPAPRGDERAVRTLADQGVPIKQIVLRTGSSRQTVRRILRGSVTTSSASARVRLSPGSSSSTKPGRAAAGTAPNSGGASEAPASAAACASFPNGQPDGGAPSGLRRPRRGTARLPGRSR
jgi:hypothetical protein